MLNVYYLVVILTFLMVTLVVTARYLVVTGHYLVGILVPTFSMNGVDLCLMFREILIM